jgi:hypothetical protein
MGLIATMKCSRPQQPTGAWALAHTLLDDRTEQPVRALASGSAIVSQIHTSKSVALRLITAFEAILDMVCVTLFCSVTFL